MKTLVRIVKLVDGFELWYRIEGKEGVYETVYHKRAV